MEDTSAHRVVEEVLEDDGIPSGVEKELEDDGSIGIVRPFDPEKIKIARETKTVSLLDTRITHGEIDLFPDFQRNSGLWTSRQKSRLIESLLLRIPLPAFYVACDQDENWAVVDGLQRLSTIHTFIHGQFQLTGLEYLVQFDKSKFDDLPRSMQRRIEETELVLNVIQPGTPEEVMFNIFSRINTGGMTLNGQEIRHALNKGPARAYLMNLANSNEFLAATESSISTKRMLDRECVLRFLAFWLRHWEQYQNNDLDGFLNTTMKALNRMENADLGAASDAFRRSMVLAKNVFGDDAFRKRYSIEDPRKPISKPLFEIWSVCLAKLTQEQGEVLLSRRNAVQTAFSELLRDDREFEAAITNSTNVPARVHKRFQAIEDLIARVLE
ncbi:DUF262 domain-containing protein [uncultured Litoreibacter sp.]|uniref:DUF262 domain-containing protein n=1 Tax=uncultured Litoreibacter sp. TaxID=1392394 RepID=UPI00260F8A81|nr:DUF262 domain-containing protein [uncultured Litoreibacter sp.]